MMSVRAVVVAVVAAILLQGCSSLWGGGAEKPAATQAAAPPAQSLGAQCSQVEPYSIGVASEEGGLERVTFEANLKEAFAAADSDKSGALSRSELEPVNASRAAMNNGASPIQDWNGDGKVSFEEYAAPSRTMFDLCDRNRDNILSSAELQRNPGRDRDKLLGDHKARPSQSPGRGSMSTPTGRGQ